MREGGGTPISIPRYRELTADRVLMSAASKALEGPDALTRCGARGAKEGCAKEWGEKARARVSGYVSRVRSSECVVYDCSHD